MPRVYVRMGLRAGGEVGLGAAQAHYLGTVMRRGVGDAVVLFNGEDGEWDAEIVAAGRQGTRLRAVALRRAQGISRALTLAFAPLKREATDWVVQKATELGVSVIQPVLTERSHTLRVNLQRFQAIAVEAAEQCERLDLPALRAPIPLAAFLEAWPREDRLAACIERSRGVAPNPAMAGLLVGPEGGFAARELDVMRRHPFLVEVSLGALVLRAETAAIAGLALLAAR